MPRDYFDDQAAALRRLCDFYHDPDNTASARRLHDDERRERELKRADDEEDGERWDLQS